LDDGTQHLVTLLIENRSVFTQELALQTAKIGTLYQTTEANIKGHIDQNQAELMRAVAARTLQEDRRKEDILLQHLSFPTLDVRYEEIDPAHAKTFQWIFDDFSSPNSDSFTDWLEGKVEGERLYWINGKAGSGKSTLMKYIYDDPRTRSKLSEWTAGLPLTMASFFFWISGDADQCSQTGLLRSLLHHLLSQHRHLIREVFADMWKAVEISPVLRAWSLAYASKALRDLLSRDLGKVVLFIDGLDEYHGDHGNHLSADRPEYYSEIVGLIKSLSSPDIKICFSSRPLVVFHSHFDSQPKLRLQDLTHLDISTYVKDKLSEDTILDTLRLDCDWDSSQLISDIVNKAEGVFMWIVLVVRSLLSGIENYDDIEDLRRRLKQCPSDLMALYRHMLSQIQPTYLSEGYKIFSMTDAAMAMAQQQKERGPLSGGHFEELCMIGLWFGLAHSNTVSRMNQNLSSEEQIVKVIKEIERKLKTRCAGLLETGRAMPLWQPDPDGFASFTSTSHDGSPDMTWYGRDNVLMEAKYGNRKIQYIHRSIKDFLALEETKLLLKRSRPSDWNAKCALLWSTIQRIIIHEPEPLRPRVDRRPKDDLWCLADSGLLLAQALQQEGDTSHIVLLDQLDLAMQVQQAEHEAHWVVNAFFKIYEYHKRYEQPYNTKRATIKSQDQEGEVGYSDESVERQRNMPHEEYEFVNLDPRFGDDFLSLVIVYGLSDYVGSKMQENPSILKQKVGRPYLDYALASHDRHFVDVNPRIVQMLLKAGADPNEYCPTNYSIAEWEDSKEGRAVGFGYDAWTPWRSALESVLWTEFGRVRQRTSINTQQAQNWIRVFNSLLESGADVRVDTWVMFKGPDESYTVPDVIQIIFGCDFPEDAANLITTVDRLAAIQKPESCD
jgi:hypothetical protein